MKILLGDTSQKDAMLFGGRLGLARDQVARQYSDFILALPFQIFLLFDLLFTLREQQETENATPATSCFLTRRAGLSDPFVVVAYTDQITNKEYKVQSNTVPKNLNPTWLFASHSSVLASRVFSSATPS